jgi:hypothetical protein
VGALGCPHVLGPPHGRPDVIEGRLRLCRRRPLALQGRQADGRHRRSEPDEADAISRTHIRLYGPRLRQGRTDRERGAIIADEMFGVTLGDLVDNELKAVRAALRAPCWYGSPRAESLSSPSRRSSATAATSSRGRMASIARGRSSPSPATSRFLKEKV